MKLKNLAVIFLFHSLAALASDCPTGGSCGGGGNSLSSESADVKAVVKALPKEGNLLGLVSEAQTRQYLNPKYVSDPDVKKLLKSLSGSSPGLVGQSGVELLQDAMASKFEAKDRCLHDGKESDAATSFYRQAPICFSTQRLSRHSKENLREEIATLLMHELAHHFGANEKVANKFQNYMAPFVREFYRGADGAAKLGASADVLEIRPSGLARVKGACGDVVVRCSGAAAPQGGDGLQLTIAPGQRLAIGPKGSQTTVVCKSLPTVDCRVQMVDGKKIISYGDLKSYWSWTDKDPDERLRILQLANVCKKTQTGAVEEGNGATNAAPAN